MGAAGRHDDAAPRHDPVGGLSFPDVPRLELDELLGQLIHRADDVLATQGRLRGLLRANAAVAADLSLPVVLRRIVDAARDLLGARYAALGVVGRDGQLEQFVHAGIARRRGGGDRRAAAGPRDPGPADQQPGPDPPG